MELFVANHMTKTMEDNIELAKIQWRINIDVIFQIILFSNRLIQRFDSILNQPANSLTIKDLFKKIKTELNQILDGCKLQQLSPVLHFKIHYNKQEHHVEKTAEQIKHIIVQNIQNQTIFTEYDFSIIGGYDSYSLERFTFRHPTKTMCIEITNWLFDKLDDQHFKNYYSLYDVVKTLQYVFGYSFKKYYHCNECRCVLIDIFKNIYCNFKPLKPLEKIQNIVELSKSIQLLFFDFEHAYAMGQINKPSNNKRELSDLNIVKTLFIETIDEIQKIKELDKCSMKKIATTIFEIVDSKMKIICEIQLSEDDLNDDDFYFNMFNESVSIVYYIKNCYFAENPELCLNKDYVVFREKLLFIVIHDVETNQETAPNGKCELCFADSYISFNVVKFL